MDTGYPKPNPALKLFKWLNLASVLLWFAFTKKVIGTPVFPYLAAMHAAATWGYIYLVYRCEPQKRGAILLLAGMVVVAVGGFWLHGRHSG